MSKVEAAADKLIMEGGLVRMLMRSIMAARHIDALCYENLTNYLISKRGYSEQLAADVVKEFRSKVVESSKTLDQDILTTIIREDVLPTVSVTLQHRKDQLRKPSAPSRSEVRSSRSTSSFRTKRAATVYELGDGISLRPSQPVVVYGTPVAVDEALFHLTLRMPLVPKYWVTSKVDRTMGKKVAGGVGPRWKEEIEQLLLPAWDYAYTNPTGFCTRLNVVEGGEEPRFIFIMDDLGYRPNQEGNAKSLPQSKSLRAVKVLERMSRATYGRGACFLAGLTTLEDGHDKKNWTDLSDKCDLYTAYGGGSTGLSLTDHRGKEIIL